MTPEAVLAGEARWCVERGDALACLRALPDACVDAVVCDPPAGIAFMGRAWDKDKGGRDAWIAWLAEIMREALRVLKPGGHAVVWALPRTSHWTARAVEDAGFEIRDKLTHHFGNGFPKSLDVSKAIDNAAGAVRPVVGTKEVTRDFRGKEHVADPSHATTVVLTSAASAASAAWEGWGTALKPASEDWILARKPLAGTVAANVLEHGTGALHIDACRVGAGGDKGEWPITDREKTSESLGPKNVVLTDNGVGRWPANLLLTHAWGCNGVCVEGCPVAELDRQSGESTSTTHERGSGLGYQGASAARGNAGHSDSGAASRFFPTFHYIPKPATSEREAGTEHLPKKAAADLVDREAGSAGMNSPRAGAGAGSVAGRANHHPTVKPIDLMRWLIRLVTPPKGIVLDPFAGSGTTGCGAVLERVRFIGFDQDLDDDGGEAGYVAIARARIAFWDRQPDARQASLFDLLGVA